MKNLLTALIMALFMFGCVACAREPHVKYSPSGQTSYSLEKCPSQDSSDDLWWILGIFAVLVTLVIIHTEYRRKSRIRKLHNVVANQEAQILWYQTRLREQKLETERWFQQLAECNQELRRLKRGSHAHSS